MKLQQTLLVLPLLLLSVHTHCMQGRIVAHSVASMRIVAHTNGVRNSSAMPHNSLQKKQLHVNAIKGSHEGFQEVPHLSPVLAVPFAETKLLHRLYEFGTAEDATVQLVQQLFYLQNGQFRPTQNKTLAGFYLNGEIIARIILYLEQGISLSSLETQNEFFELFKKNYPKESPRKIKISQLLTLIESCHHECQQNSFYIPTLTYHILLSFLYKKYETITELQNYIRTIKQHIEKKETTPDNEWFKKLESIFNKLTSLLITQHTKNESVLTQSEYCAADLDWYSRQIEQGSSRNFLNMLNIYGEESVHYFITKQKYQSTQPPQVAVKCHSYKNNIPRPDCMETVLREICNHYLINGTDSHFDVRMIPSHCCPAQELIDFYTRYRQFDTVNTLAAGHAWFTLVSGRTFLRYRYEMHDLNARISNLLGAFNYLFGISANNLDELGSALSDANRTIRFEIKNKVADNDAVLHLTIAPGAEDKKEFDISLTPTHASIEATKKELYGDAPLLEKKKAEKLEKMIRTHARQYAHLLPVFAGEISQLESSKLLESDNLALVYTTILSLPIENADFRKTLILNLCTQLPNRPLFANIIRRLCNNIGDDGEFWFTFGHCLARYCAVQDLPTFDELLDTHPRGAEGFVTTFFDVTNKNHIISPEQLARVERLLRKLPYRPAEYLYKIDHYVTTLATHPAYERIIKEITLKNDAYNQKV